MLSANCQGLRNTEKRNDVLNFLKGTNASIVCLQDTHLTENDLNLVKTHWHECYLHGIRTNSRGVAILINNNFEYTVDGIHKDTEGNYLQLLLTCGSIKINLINLYAPNTDSPNFFSEIEKLTINDKTDYVVICGDFNLVLDPERDSQNYVNINNPKAREKVINMLHERDLVDIYRENNPEKFRYTWRKRNPIKQARLDYFLISSSMTDIVNSSSIMTSYRSDHSIIEISINLSEFKHGKGYWKFNNSLLKNQEYLNLINKTIEEEKIKYALPVYNMDHITGSNESIEFSISCDLFLETLLMRIRGESIKFASQLKRNRDLQEKHLLKDISQLEQNLDQENLNILNEKKSVLENIRKEKVKGIITRSRIQWLSEGEKPSSFFCKLENKNYIEKTIRKLELSDGTEIKEQKKILCEIEKFYSKLFEAKEIRLYENQLDKINIQTIKHISNLEIGNPISPEELSFVLKKD